MGAEVVVLYDDLTISRVAFTERFTLAKVNVLAITISHLEQPDTGLRRKRQQAILGYDYYVLSYDLVRDKCFLGGYDKTDFGWFSLTEPWGATEDWGLTELSQPPWFPPDILIFKGIQVASEIWTQALAIYNKRNGLMY